MHFLVRMWAIEPMPLARSELASLALQQLEYWERLEQQGKLVFTAPYVGRRARVAIYDADSNDELFDLINADPLFRYLDREVVPLGTNEQLRELYQRMREGS
jgi:muconolactone delta-isomerase